MKTHIVSLTILLLSGGLSTPAESLIVTNSETLEIGGSKSYENVLISNGTIYLTNDTIITSAGDIQILSGATITWHYTTTNWALNFSPPQNNSGNGQSVHAQNGTNCWNLSLAASTNLTIHGTVDLRGGAGQTHIGYANRGTGGAYFYDLAARTASKGGKGGSSFGGSGGHGANLFLQSSAGNIDLKNVTIILSGGSGGNGGHGSSGGRGGDWHGSGSGQGADNGGGGDSFGGNGGAGGNLIIKTALLNTDGWNCIIQGGIQGSAGEGGYPDEPGYGYQIIGSGDNTKAVAWNGSSGNYGNSYSGSIGTNGTIDVIKKAEARAQFENGQLSLGLDMTSTSATYTVECCTNLFTADWRPAGTFSGRGGATNWTSALSNRFDKAFYRIQTTY
jgi:hypothetical protein